MYDLREELAKLLDKAVSGDVPDEVLLAMLLVVARSRRSSNPSATPSRGVRVPRHMIVATVQVEAPDPDTAHAYIEELLCKASQYGRDSADQDAPWIVSVSVDV